MKKTSLLLSAFLVALPLVTVATHAQTPAAACGNDSVRFQIKMQKKAPAPGAPDSSHAQIVFIEATSGSFFPAPVARFAVDGNWVGAAKGASYFDITVAPGAHQLCANRQSAVASDKRNIGSVSLNAQAGTVYYYEFKIIRTEVGSPSTNGTDGLNGGRNMDIKDQPTVDNVTFTALTDAEAHARLATLPKSEAVAK